MNDVTNLPPANPAPDHCKGCGKEVEASWSVCPHCGVQLKAADDFSQRLWLWIGAFATFFAAEFVIAQQDENWAMVIGLLFGMPLLYVFAKAVFYRLRHQPLTWAELWRTSVRAFLTSFTLLVVVPVVIGVAFMIFLFMVCSGAFRH